MDGIVGLYYVLGWIHIGRIGMLCVAVFITNYIRNDRNEKVHGNYSTPSTSVNGTPLVKKRDVIHDLL